MTELREVVQELVARHGISGAVVGVLEDGVMCELDRGVSGRLAVVEAQESTEALPAYDRSGPVEVGGRHDELAGQAPMVALSVVVREVLADSGA